jgi:hypothetical protein
MRIKVSDRDQLGRLIQFLSLDPDALTTQVADDEVEVGFVGSLNTWAQQEETMLRVRAWLAANPDIVAIVRE